MSPWNITEKRAKFLATQTMRVEASLLAWLTVHGNLCLALRHPGNQGASRKWATAFVKRLGQALVKHGAISQEELKQVERLEAEYGSEDLKT